MIAMTEEAGVGVMHGRAETMVVSRTTTTTRPGVGAIATKTTEGTSRFAEQSPGKVWLLLV
jgi:hypothetical protein